MVERNREDAGGFQHERRCAREMARAKLRPGRFYPGLQPSTWYSVYTTAPPQPEYVWVRTEYGLTRVQRIDIELIAGTN